MQTTTTSDFPFRKIDEDTSSPVILLLFVENSPGTCVAMGVKMPLMTWQVATTTDHNVVTAVQFCLTYVDLRWIREVYDAFAILIAPQTRAIAL